MLLVTDLAKDINDLVEFYEYFYAYGLLRETRKLWESDINKAYLSQDARVILESITE